MFDQEKMEHFFPASQQKESLPANSQDDEIEIMSPQYEQTEPGAAVQQRIVAAAVDRVIARKYQGIGREKGIELKSQLSAKAAEILQKETGIKAQWLRALSQDFQGENFAEETQKAEDQLINGFAQRLYEGIEN